jgi:alcohol dehydrogenase class IV
MAYFMPTRIVAGQRCLLDNHTLLAELGEKALIVTGKHSAKTNGSLSDAEKALDQNGQKWALYDKVMSNPTLDCALEIARAIEDARCDFVLAIGGGSPMDAAKAAAALSAQPVQRAEIFGAAFSKALPVAAVPTTAGTGSEVTPYAILTDDSAETKRSIASPAIFPRLAFLDAAYLRGLNETVLVNTALDALSHAVEGMLSVRACAISDALAMKSLAIISSHFEAIGAGQPDAKDLEELLLASTLAGMVIANTGTTAVHALGYSLTYYRNIDHGRANGLLLARFLALVEKKRPARIAEILSGIKMETLADFDEALDGLLGKREKLSPAEIANYAKKAMKTGNIANCAPRPTETELAEVLEESLG